MVVGDRQVRRHEEFSRVKKLLQLWGSWVVRQASGTAVPDTTSGFRAYNREAALRLNVVSRFSYTLETIIQAGKTDLAVTHVPIRTNARTRAVAALPLDARSTSSARSRRSCACTRCTSRSGSSSGSPPSRRSLALVLFGRFAWFSVTQPGPTGHVQSLVVGGALLIVAFQLAALGVLADLLRANRVLAERTLHRVRRLELEAGVRPDSLAGEETEADRLVRRRSRPARVSLS